MAQTSLVKCMGEPIVGLPAIMVEESRVILTQYRGGLNKPTSRQNGIQGDLVTDTNPEPFEMGGHSPAGLIEPIDQTVTHGGLKFSSYVSSAFVPNRVIARHSALRLTAKP